MSASELSILVKAEPCPFCTSQRLWIWDKGMPGKFAICCSNSSCAATGPMANSEAEAVVFWNKAPRKRPNAAYHRVSDEAHRMTRGDY